MIKIQAWGNGPQYCTIIRDGESMSDFRSPKNHINLTPAQQQAYLDAYTIIKNGGEAEEAGAVLAPHFSKVQADELY